MSTSLRPRPNTAALPWIARPRLAAALDDAAGGRIVCVIGGPGSGKSQLVSDWLEQRGHPSVWIGLDGAEDLVARLESTLTRHEDDAVVVVDNAHLCGESIPGLMELTERHPAARLVVIGHVSPIPEPERRRAEGRAGLVQSDDLAFTSEEIAELLQRSGVPWNGETVKELHARTRGWVVGVAMIVQHLRRAACDDAAAVRAEIERIASGHAATESLIDEVLDELLPEDLQFLVRASVTPRLTPRLAAALTLDDDAMEPDDAAVVAASRRIRQLAASQFLIADTQDPDAVLLHPLLQERLAARLRQRPALRSTLLMRVSRWYEQTGRPLLALRSAIDAEDWVAVGTLTLSSVSILFAGQERPALLNELARIPPRLAIKDPGIAIALAALDFCEARFAALHRSLAVARATISARHDVAPTTRAALHILEAETAIVMGDGAELDRASRAARAAVAMLDPHAVPVWALYDDVASNLAGQSAVWRGDLAAAIELLADRTHGAEQSDYVRVRWSGYRALALAMAGRTEAADALVRETTSSTEVAGWNAGALTLARTFVATDSGRTADAALLVAELMPLIDGGLLDPFVSAVTRTIAVQLDLQRHGVARARRAIAALPAAEGAWHDADGWQAWGAARVELAAGEVAAATTMLDRAIATRPDRGLRDRLDVLRGWCAAAESSDVVAVLDPAPPGPIPPITRCEAALLTFVHVPDDADPAVAELLLATDRRVLGCIIPLAFELLRPSLVAVAASTSPASEIAAELLGRRARFSDTDNLDARLTPREREVLALLTTLLSAAEIAARLHISEHTVRQHSKAIYRKLGVGRRRDAVLLAAARGLLDT